MAKRILWYFPDGDDKRIVRNLRSFTQQLSESLAAKLTEVMGSLQGRIKQKASGELP